jgi:hypothetical protein
VSSTNTIPTTYQRDLAKLPLALAPLIERPQWAIWRWTQRPDGSWQKPPYQAMQPARHASTNDPSTWTDYDTALAAVQAGHANGLSYVLTKDDPFGAIDLDHCRDKLCSIDVWAQNFMQAAVHTYQEVTPSGEGIRIWGLAAGDSLNSKYTLEINEKKVAAELFRRTNKALTITGYTLNPDIRNFANIDKVFDWAVIWGERRKAEMIKATAPTGGNGFDSSGCKYSIDEIEQIVREGAPRGANRSDVFHAIIGHYVGCGWQPERILEHLQQYPDGIGSRYLREDRLEREVARSAAKFAKAELPLPGNSSGWTQEAPPEPEPPAQEKERPIDDPELEDDPDPEVEDEDIDDDEAEPEHTPGLPPLRRLGDCTGPPKEWLLKGLAPRVGTGLLGGKRGAGKTFAALDFAGSVMTGQPFLNHMMKRHSGILWLAAEGHDEVELRLEALVREKCGKMPHVEVPFRWRDKVPQLLDKNAVKQLTEIARQAEAELAQDHELPLGLIVVDTITSCAGYSHRGDENDNAVATAMMLVLQTLAQNMGCFVLAVAHLSETGIRGGKSKEEITDVIWACLSDHEFGTGPATNTRLIVEKNRGGKDGLVFPYTLRLVEAPEKDEDGDPITTRVVDWLPPGSAEAAPAPDDPWAKPKRQDQRTAALRLKRVLMAILAEQGTDLPIEPGGPVVRMVDEKVVRKAFYACTPTPTDDKEQKSRFRRQKFLAALEWAEQNQLIGAGEIDEVGYLWLARPKTEDEEDPD